MTFWQSLKNNWYNGNFAKWTQVIGLGAFGVGLTGMVVKNPNGGGAFTAVIPSLIQG